VRQGVNGLFEGAILLESFGARNADTHENSGEQTKKPAFAGFSRLTGLY
jgi:hypothetical protein